MSSTLSVKTFIDTGNYVSGVFIDLQKAFDTVNHDILCEIYHTMVLEVIVNYLLNHF